jgi:hypothetical protein
MLSIRPVLLVGTGDVSNLRAVLRAHGCGTMLAPSVDQACLMLRHFRVDAIVTYRSRADELRALAKFRTPLVLVSADAVPVSAVKCAAVASASLGSVQMAQIVMGVINSERAIRDGRTVAPRFDQGAHYGTQHPRRR